MSVRRSGLLVMAVSVAALLGSPSADALAKRKPKPKTRMVAMVNGKLLKGKRPIIAVYASTSFSINAASRPKRRIVRTVTANCLGDVKAVALPTTFTSCYGTYTEAGSRAPARDWSGTMEVTVESFDGTRIVGTFRGTLALATPAGEPPATVENGSFSIALTDIGV